MSIFDKEIVVLPEITAETIKELSSSKLSSKLSREDLIKVIDDIVHSIYYNVKVRLIPDNGEWKFKGEVFGIPSDYAIGPVWETVPKNYREMVRVTNDNIEYIKDIFTKLGFEFEYIKDDADRDLRNIVIIRVPGLNKFNILLDNM